MPLVSAPRLSELTAGIFRALGASRATAAAVAEGLVDANLAGHDSHGVLRVSAYVAAVEQGRVDPRAEPVLERDAGSVLVVDGHRGFGQVTAGLATEAAIARVRAGTALVAAVAHDGYHAGRIGAYAARVAGAGYVGLAAVNSHGGGRLVAPHGASARRLSTNPIAFAVPRAGAAPLLLDMSTAVVAEGKVRLRRSRGEPVPPGWVVDADGEPGTRPEALYGPPPGALLPLGSPLAGHKGFGLSMMVEVLAGAMSGAGCSRPEADWSGNGFFLLALDPAAFRGIADFQADVERLIAFVKSAPPLAGVPEVLVAGEPEQREAARRAREGIEVEDATWDELTGIAARLGVAPAE